MAEILDKESPLMLPQQLKDILQRRIEQGYYQPGRKMDSVRKIAAEFNVSSLTVQRSVKYLEAEGFVVSVPASGVYINEQFAKESKIVNIAFVFPEAAISRETLRFEEWAISSEIHRGLLTGAQAYGAQIDFIHVPENLDLLRMLRQQKRLSKYDALVFTGEQLMELQKELAKTKPVFHFVSHNSCRDLLNVDYDRENAVEILARHAAECGCRSAGTVSYFDTGVFDPETEKISRKIYRERAELFLKYCRKYGLVTPPEFQFEFDSGHSPDAALRKSLSAGYPDFIFCNHTYFVINLYEACNELGIKIGQDLKIGAIATGFTFSGLLPSLTYVKIPMYEMAENIVRNTCRLLKSEKIDATPITATLVAGKSTIKNKAQEQ